MNVAQWWRGGPSSARLRRRLLVCSAPVALLLVLALVKLCSIAFTGGAAAADFTARNADALRRDVAALSLANVVEPERAYFAAGSLAVLDDRLDDADTQFTEALTRTEPARSCATRVNLELVRETLGDRSAFALDSDKAIGWYRSALTAVDEAPQGCFGGSTDPDEQRRALLESAASRLHGKIDALRVAPPAPPPLPPVPPPGSPPPPPPPATTSDQPDQGLRLDPGGADPLERLQQILRDAATAQREAPR